MEDSENIEQSLAHLKHALLKLFPDCNNSYLQNLNKEIGNLRKAESTEQVMQSVAVIINNSFMLVPDSRAGPSE